MSEIKRGKPHELKPSPCQTCPQEKKCPVPCEGWKNWMRENWRTVTGRTERHE